MVDDSRQVADFPEADGGEVADARQHLQAVAAALHARGIGRRSWRSMVLVSRFPVSRWVLCSGVERDARSPAEDAASHRSRPVDVALRCESAWPPHTAAPPPFASDFQPSARLPSHCTLPLSLSFSHSLTLSLPLYYTGAPQKIGEREGKHRDGQGGVRATAESTLFPTTHVRMRLLGLGLVVLG